MIFGDKMIKIIVAYNKHRIIGVDGGIPWKIKEDINHFMQTTMGNVCIMGRKTWESIPQKYQPLSNRANVILTRDVDKYVDQHPELESMEETYIFDDLMIAIETMEFQYPDKDIFIMGGGEIYQQAIDNKIVREMIVSEIKGYEDISEGTTFNLPAGSWKGTLIKEFDEFDVWSWWKYHDKCLIINDSQEVELK